MSLKIRSVILFTFLVGCSGLALAQSSGGNRGGNGTVSRCTSNSFAQYLVTGSVIGCAPNLTESTGVLSYLGSGGVVANLFTTNGPGAGQLTLACASPLQAPASGSISFTAPTSCTPYSVIFPTAQGTANQVLGISSVSGSVLNLAFQDGLPSGTGVVRVASEPSTPTLSFIGLNTTNDQLWFVPGFTDNATSPNKLYTALRYDIDSDDQNLYQLQYLNKCIAGIEKAVSGTFCVLAFAGDSDTSGVNTTASVIVELMNMLQSASTGWGYAGPGYMSVGTSKNPSPYGTSISYTTSGTWSLCAWTTTISNGHDSGTDCWGPDNQDATDATPTIGDYVQWAMTGTVSSTDAFIYYAKVSGGGSFQASLDGVSCGSATSTNGTGIGSVHCSGTQGTHTLKAQVTTSSSPVTILGAIGVDSTANGVVVLKMAAAQNTASNFATNTKYSALMTQIQSDLSGLSGFATGVTLWSQQWGANEWTQNLTPASMVTAMGTLNSAFTGAGASADYMIVTDNDDGLGGTTNSLGFTMAQYDYAHQQFASANRYAFFSSFRRTYPARTAFCGTLHLTSGPCQRALSTHLLNRMLGHGVNPAHITARTGVFATTWTMSTSTGVVGSPITLLPTSLATGLYRIGWRFAEATAGNCTTPGTLKADFSFADPDSGLAAPGVGAAGSYHGFFANLSGSVASGSMTVSSSITSGNVYSGEAVIYASNGTALIYQGDVTSGATGGTCNTQATVIGRVFVEGPF